MVARASGDKDARQTEVNPTYTITFGDVAENHAGMQMIGALHERGFTLEDLTEIQRRLEALGVATRMHSLSDVFPTTLVRPEEALGGGRNGVGAQDPGEPGCFVSIGGRPLSCRRGAEREDDFRGRGAEREDDFRVHAAEADATGESHS
jgi:hypothetical protein